LWPPFDSLDTRNVAGYTKKNVIKSFAHFFQAGSKAGIQPKHEERLRLILTALNAAMSPRDMGLPGLGLHHLTGELAGFWATRVSGNYRVIFKFGGTNAVDVDYVDYH
jgi:toxin HigB-1